MTSWLRPSGVAVLLLAAMLLMPGAAHGESSAPVEIFVRRATPADAYGPRGPLAAFGSLDREAVHRFRVAAGGRMDLPLADGTSLTLVLERFDVLAPGAVVTATGGGGPVPVTPDVTLFKGRVEGDEGSFVVLAMSSGRMMGMIEHAGHRLLVEPLTAAGSDHAVADAVDMPAPPPFMCGTTEEMQVGPEPLMNLPALPADVQATTTRLVANMALDCDYEFFVRAGSDSVRAVNYALMMLGTVSAIYERDINVQLEASYVNVWTTSADPYAATSPSGALSEFQSWWNANRAAVPRDEAQLLSGRTLGGGIAYLNSLCSLTSGYSVLGNLSVTNTYPTNSTTWDVEVMAHEWGHSFGSYHTHSCWWQANGYAAAGALLDSCYAEEANPSSCFTGTTGIVPPDKGTIMSYCHQVGGGLANIRLDFHWACKAVMRNASEAACFSAATVQPPLALAVDTSAGMIRLTWTPSSSPNIERYDLYRSTQQLDPYPYFVGSTTDTAYVGHDIGTFWYKVRAVRSADWSAFSGEVKVTQCLPSAVTTYPLGQSPSSVIAADVNGDGILDLVTANGSSGTVSVLLGLGSEGSGNGRFGAPATYNIGAGTAPAALATGDLDGDGILDLAVANQSAGTVAVMLGSGTGGVGDGAFGPPMHYRCVASPSGVVARDFNADGILDLAVTGYASASYVSVLLGRGTAGVPNGTFAVATNYAAGAYAQKVIAIDINSDGAQDLIVGGGASVLLGRSVEGVPDGTFDAPIAYGASGYGPSTGDFNGDGIVDLVVPNEVGIYVMLGNGSGGRGDGTFGAAVKQVSVGDRAVAVGDWNDDAIADLVGFYYGRFFPGLSSAGVPTGAFGSYQKLLTVGATQYAVGDFNGDSTADFAVPSGSNVVVTLAACPNTLPMTLQVTSPIGGERWIAGDHASIRWHKGPGVLAVDVAVSWDDGAHWQTLASGLTDTSFTWTVAGAFTSDARVRVLDPTMPGRGASSPAGFTIIPSSMLGAGEDLAAVFALRGVRPNPSRGASLGIDFSLPASGRASLDLFDVGGRCVARHELDFLGAGFHSLELRLDRSLPAGLYFLRLGCGHRAQVARVIVLP